jgi:hypothetical protein
MEILKEGRKETEIYIGECIECGCVIKVEKNELSSYSPGDYRNDHEPFGYHKCPVGCVCRIACHRSDTKTANRIIIENHILF